MLVVLNTAVMFLGYQENVTIVFNIVVGLKAVLIILNYSLVMRVQLWWLCPKKRKNRTVPHSYLTSLWDHIDGCHLKDIKGIDEDLILFLEGLGSQFVSIDLDIPMIVDHFLLILKAQIDDYLK